MSAKEYLIGCRLVDDNGTGTVESQIYITPPDSELSIVQWEAIRCCLLKTLELEKPKHYDCSQSVSNSSNN